MKKYTTLALLAIAPLYAQADYRMIINGPDIQEDLCVKSYSYSNNLESLHREVAQAQGYDLYSTSETLTNKIWKGKPVYRKIVELGDLRSQANNNKHWKFAAFNIADIDELTSSETLFIGNANFMSFHIDDRYNARYYVNKDGIHYVFSLAYKENLADVSVTVEYTKTTDSQQQPNPATTMTSYVHFIESSSLNNEVKTYSINDKAVTFTKGYKYDAANGTCELL
ncbi:hypothetical protein [Photobacterium kasasachensis]|uniref:hypothetical protein n=1 Tax=Photobacterium kasasachensis TaxID=2910240 RepID=UPI003D0EE209